MRTDRNLQHDQVDRAYQPVQSVHLARHDAPTRIISPRLLAHFGRNGSPLPIAALERMGSNSTSNRFR